MQQAYSAKRRAEKFLRAHLPQSDIDSYSPSLFFQFLDHALALRESAPWCAALDEEIFFHYVLFPRVNDEDITFHREIFRTALWDRIVSLPTVEEKALEVNRWCCEIATYEMQDDRTASPLTVYRNGSGRCGEESAFAVSALRSVGIAARQVYSPRWAHCDDNHAWVEVLCGDEWKFFGACEPEPVLNRGWFNTPASRALLVHSRLFGEGDHPLHGEEICREGNVRWYNQTARYARTRRCRFRVETDGSPVADAVIDIQVLNEASFHTIATLTADQNGEAEIELGLGDFHVLARFCGRWAECDVRGEEMTVLHLSPLHSGDTEWQTADYIAPADFPVNPAPLTAEQKKERKYVRELCAAIREERKRNADAGGISSFLALDADPRRRKLVDTLTEKDHRDVTAETLTAHLRHLPPRRKDVSEEDYWQYTACPRIELEPLTPWREPLSKVLSQRGVNDADEVFALLQRELVCSEENTYANLVTPPADSWAARRGSKRDVRLLAVAMLRALGIPARLRACDSEVEFYCDGKWNTRRDEAQGILKISDERAVYRQNYTVSRREDTGWKLMNCSGREITLPIGQYRVVTSVRLPNGNQLAAWRDISLAAGEQKEISLLLREYAVSEMLCSRDLVKMSAATLAGKQVEDICRMDGRASLLLWCEEGGEPTEHILLELMELQTCLRALPVNIVFLLRSADSLRQTTLAAAAEQLGAVCLIPEDWEFDVEQTARHLTCDPDTPPLAVVCDRAGSAVYGTSGYSVGAAQQLLRITEYVAKK